ncbi:hypothetical protein QL285_044683 [Trifolium repens]|nr:hypothetical protein QL285_044683 [Trifolium repens]
MSDAAGNDGGKKNEFSYNYDSNAHERKSSDKVLFFNGTETAYPFWKTKMYSHIIGIDCDLWDLDEEGVAFNNMDKKRVVSYQNRKSFTPTQKLEYKKHHSVKGMMTNAISHDEYLKIGDKRTTKSIWESLKSKYEGNKQVREAKANLLVHQYELFKMKDGEDIETMFSRFQILVSCLQVLDKSYTVAVKENSNRKAAEYKNFPLMILTNEHEFVFRILPLLKILFFSFTNGG